MYREWGEPLLISRPVFSAELAQLPTPDLEALSAQVSGNADEFDCRHPAIRLRNFLSIFPCRVVAIEKARTARQ
jgi:hypothetical protein